MMHRDIDPIARKNLLTMAEALAEAKGVGFARISRLAHGDTDTLDKLRRDKKSSITFRKYDDMMRFFRDLANWPKGTKPPRISRL